MKKVITILGFVAVAVGTAAADGINKPAIHTPAPAPLQAHADGAPSVHYGNSTVKGTRIYSTSCGRGDSEVCSGQYVSTGRVVLAGEAPAYVESVDPIIHRAGTYQASEIQHYSEHAHSKDTHHRKGKKRYNQQTKLDGNLTGGVGAGVSSNWIPGGYAIVGSTRSRSSVYYGHSSGCASKPRPYFVRRYR